MLCYAMLRYATLSYVTLCYVTLCYVSSKKLRNFPYTNLNRYDCYTTAGNCAVITGLLKSWLKGKANCIVS